MKKPSLQLWEIRAHVTGEQPSDFTRWRLTNGFSGNPDPADDMYECTFTIIAPEAEHALLWAEAKLSDIPDVTFSNPVRKHVDVIIHEVTDLTPLLKG